MLAEREGQNMLLAPTWIFDRLSVKLIGHRQSPDTVETDGRRQVTHQSVGSDSADTTAGSHSANHATEAVRVLVLWLPAAWSPGACRLWLDGPPHSGSQRLSSGPASHGESNQDSCLQIADHQSCGSPRCSDLRSLSGLVYPSSDRATGTGVARAG
jgi:hypothetical protein